MATRAGLRRVAAVQLGAHTVVLVFEEGLDLRWSVLCGSFFAGRLGVCGEARDGFLWRVDRRGEHEAQGMEQGHTGLGEGAGEGVADGFAKISLEHDGMADLCGSDGSFGAGCGCDDGLFDQRLLYADAHVPDHELEQVLGFNGRGTAEEAFDEGCADGSGAGDGHGGEDLGDLGQRQLRRVIRPPSQQVEGGPRRGLRVGDRRRSGRRRRLR